MEKTITDRQLLTEVLTRLGDRQISALVEDLGRESPAGRKLLKILEEIPGEREAGAQELKEMLKRELELSQGSGKGFFEALISFVDRAQKKDSEVYNAAGMNRSLWYRLRDHRTARTSKQNVLKMALILKLDYWELYYLVNLAGYSLLPSEDSTDKIVAFCVRHGLYDTARVDELLVEAGEEPLFSES